MSQSGPNTTRTLANARAPRIRRQTPSASVSPAFVRPAHYRRMPVRTTRTQPVPPGPAFVRPAHYRRMPVRTTRTQPVPPGPAFVRPAHYRRMQDRMEMPARIEMLGDIFLDVFNTPPPRINRGNLFTSASGFIGRGLLIDSTIILEVNLGAQTSAIRLDAFVQMEKTLVFSNGAITFDA
ncbi:hypothetical protein T492DRAFT_837108 [Pavlovales sp. CCMP2436]|nr:hypothetical protein T492DRAFT_837108 [Pavlovales sp. CCMP2436]